jgi:uncharacterized protein DUF4238
MGTKIGDRPRRQHIVPEMHLGCFANKANQVCVYQRNVPLRWSSIAKAAVERDYHEYSVGRTKSDYRIEQTLANLEGRAASIRLKLLGRTSLSRDEIGMWALFLASLFLRTRKVRSQITSRLAIDLADRFRSPEELRGIQHEFFKRGSLVPLNEVARQVNKHLDKMISSPAFLHLSGFHKNVPNLAYSICQRVWHVSAAPEGSCFVTSDCPVLTGEIREQKLFLGHGFALPNATVFFAMNPQSLFVAAPTGSNWPAGLGSADVDLLNLATVRYAHREVYASRESIDIQRVVDANINQIEFGRDAYISVTPRHAGS